LPDGEPEQGSQPLARRFKRLHAGRLHRLHAGKQEVRIFDYADREVPMLARMFEKRLRGYRAIGYEQRELPDGYEGVSDEPIIEWDEGALRTLNDPI
jgi:hypothetical protein